MKTTEQTRAASPRTARGAEKRLSDYLEQAGITVNGAQDWDPQVHDPRFFSSALYQGSMGLGEAYLDGWWDCEDLGEFFRRLVLWRNDNLGDWRLILPELFLNARAALFNLQTRGRARQVIDVHYDLPVPLFEPMLGPSMAYSCAYWPGAESLDQAQWNKLDLICRKLDLQPGERVLDLGCGFGSFSKHAAEHYGCEIVAVTLSGSQAEFARRHCAGLPVEFHVCDYRETDRYSGRKPFDKIANIAMFEAIGKKNFRGFMEIVKGLLADDGLWMMHTIAADRLSTDPWLNRYIFPNGVLPNLESLDRSMRDLFLIEDAQNLSLDYAPTLTAWRTNFITHWETIRASDPERFDERFYRMWIYYLESCRGSFASKNTFVWHLVMTQPGRPGRYTAAR